MSSSVGVTGHLSRGGPPKPSARRTPTDGLREYAAFLAEDNRIPSGASSAPEDERSLDRWIDDILYGEPRNEEVLKVRRELVTLRTPYGAFERNASALEAFVRKVGRTPRASEEPQLAAWLVGQRTKHRRGATRR